MGVFNGNIIGYEYRSSMCAVCRNNISDLSNVYYSRTTFSYVCIDCRKRFCSDDIELILNLLVGYGGYFGKLRVSDEGDCSTGIVITNFLNENKKAAFTIDELLKRLLHQFILYGYTPEDYIRHLSSETLFKIISYFFFK